MANVKIRVETISNEELATQKQGQEAKGQNSEKLLTASLFVHQAMNVGKQIVNYAVSNIGNYTGDYVKQDRVQQAMDVVSTIGTIGVAFATNWVAGILTVGALAVKEGLNYRSEQQNIKHAENNAEYLRKRSGNSLTNGSRN